VAYIRPAVGYGVLRLKLIELHSGHGIVRILIAHMYSVVLRTRIKTNSYDIYIYIWYIIQIVYGPIKKHHAH